MDPEEWITPPLNPFGLDSWPDDAWGTFVFRRLPGSSHRCLGVGDVQLFAEDERHWLRMKRACPSDGEYRSVVTSQFCLGATSGELIEREGEGS